MLRAIFRSLVSGIGRRIQVFGFRCRARDLYLNLCPHPNLQPRPGTREWAPANHPVSGLPFQSSAAWHL